MKECIGCGYCCRKAPCVIGATSAVDGVCSHLHWNGECWRCDMAESHRTSLAIGEGCCSSMNTYRAVKHAPSPEELQNEEALLRQLSIKAVKDYLQKYVEDGKRAMFLGVHIVEFDVDTLYGLIGYLRQVSYYGANPQRKEIL